jgi:hypothetical protein
LPNASGFLSVIAALLLFKFLTYSAPQDMGANMRILKLMVGIAIISLTTANARAVELSDTMAQIMATLPGTYDTTAQVEREAKNGVRESERHPHRHVIYARIEVPAIGANVLFRQERKDGPVGEIIARSLAVFEPDTQANGIRMWLRNIINAERFDDLHLKPGLWNDVRFDPAYGGKCPFHWRTDAGILTGTLLGGGCKITSNAGKAMSFDAWWKITSAALSIFDNSYDGDGKLLSGRADKVPTVYSRKAN